MSRFTQLYQKIIKGRLLIALGMVIWLFLFLTTVSRTYAYYLRNQMELEMGYIFFRAFLIWAIPLLFVPVFIQLAKKWPLDGTSKYRNGLIHLVLSLSFVFVHAALFRFVMLARYYLINPNDIEWSVGYFFQPYMTIISWLVIIGPLAYWLIVGAYHYKMYYAQFRDRQLKNAELESELSSIRLQVLKIQLHPHFLFNTLHNINSLMYEDAEKAKQMLSLLKKFLQLSLNKMDRQILPLSDELEFTEIYLEIIKIRFSDRLSIEKEIDPDALSARVPGLVLQPLVENAVRHGIAKKINPGAIRITATKEGGMLKMTVEDDGPGLQGEPNENGVGLQNIRQRLEQLYSGYTFDLGRSTLGGLKVVIEIPYQPVQEPILVTH